MQSSCLCPDCSHITATQASVEIQTVTCVCLSECHHSPSDDTRVIYEQYARPPSRRAPTASQPRSRCIMSRHITADHLDCPAGIIHEGHHAPQRSSRHGPIFWQPVLWLCHSDPGAAHPQRHGVVRPLPAQLCNTSTLPGQCISRTSPHTTFVINSAVDTGLAVLSVSCCVYGQAACWAHFHQLCWTRTCLQGS